MEFKGLIISSVLIGLFIVAMLQGFNYLASENQVQNPLTQDTAVNNSLNSLNQDLSDLNRTSNNIRSAFDSEKSTFATGFLLFGSILDASKQLMNFIVNIFQISFDLITEKLGVPPLILGVFASIVLITAVLLAWKLVKGGE